MAIATDPILPQVEAFLKRSGMTASRFGRATLGDPHLVQDLRVGRGLLPKTRAKTAQYMDQWNPDSPMPKRKPKRKKKGRSK